MYKIHGIAEHGGFGWGWLGLAHAYYGSPLCGDGLHTGVLGDRLMYNAHRSRSVIPNNDQFRDSAIVSFLHLLVRTYLQMLQRRRFIKNQTTVYPDCGPVHSVVISG